MPRPLRIEYEYACYHVMNRGINHQDIFLNNKNKFLFLSLLEEIHNKFNIEIHAYCLMSNHYHLLVRTPLANLGLAMRHLNGIYTQKFNLDQKRDGPLFRGRYKAILIHLEDYFLRVSRYIHLNPVSANLCQDPADFYWSSYHFFIKNNSKNSWLNTELTLDLLKDISQDKNAYSKFVHNGIDIEISEFYSKTQLASILGKNEFILQHLKKVLEDKKMRCSADFNRTSKVYRIEKIFETISAYFKFSIDELKSGKCKNAKKFRSIAIYISCEFCQISHTEISQFLKNILYRSISNKIYRFKTKLNSDKNLQIIIADLIKKLA